ncbi:MAG: PT domain-containing protein [Chloroflexota bacterium]|nr:PT domain-containing protein [Chloroflexota bacterium]
MNEKDIHKMKGADSESDNIKKKKFLEQRSSWVILGILLALLIVLLGALAGYQSGIKERLNLAETQAAPKIQSQLANAKQDIEDGRYEVALDRLDWILEEMSPYLSEEEEKEVGDLYSQTLLRISTYRTPTPEPSPTPTEPAFTPTPDLRGEEELFNNAQQLIADESWDEAVKTLEVLRQKNIDYRPVQVDGLLYVALRNRGLDKILIEGNLEPGIYDLTLAEGFAPLDSSAEGVRNWTRMYLTGASYWDVDWAQAIYYFEQVYPQLPYLHDETYMTTTERYRIALYSYGTQLANNGEVCEALEYFERSFEVSPDPEVQPTAQWVAEECERENKEEREEPKNTSTPVPTTVNPTAESTIGPTEEQPTDESTDETPVEPTAKPTATTPEP